MLWILRALELPVVVQYTVLGIGFDFEFDLLDDSVLSSGSEQLKMPEWKYHKKHLECVEPDIVEEHSEECFEEYSEECSLLAVPTLVLGVPVEDIEIEIEIVVAGVVAVEVGVPVDVGTEVLPLL